MRFSDKFYREYMNEDEVILNDSWKNDIFDAFMSYMEEGKIPGDRKVLFGMIRLMKDWECKDFMIEYVKRRFFCEKNTGTIFRNGEKYDINVEQMMLMSSEYNLIMKENPHHQFEVDDEYNNEAFSEFLDLIHCRIEKCSPENAYSVFCIAKGWKVDYLENLLNEENAEFAISSILHIQHKESFDSTSFEEIISMNLGKFLKLDCFSDIQFPIIQRIFQKTESVLSIESITLFFSKLLEKSHYSPISLIPYLRFPSNTSAEEYEKMYSDLSHIERGNFFSQQHKIILSYIDSNKILNAKIIEIEKNYIEKQKKKEFQKIGQWKQKKPDTFVTNIFEAVILGNIESLIYLLANGSSIDSIKNDSQEIKMVQVSGLSLLHFAAIHGHCDIIKYLLSNSSKIESKDSV